MTTLETRKPVDCACGQYSLLVAADFVIACRRIHTGFIDVTTAEEPIEIRSGVFLHGQDHLVIPGPEWFDYSEAKARLLSRLGLAESEVFPVSYTLRVLIEGEHGRPIGALP